MLDSQHKIHQNTLFDKFKEWLSISDYNDKYNTRRFKVDLGKIEIKQEKDKFKMTGDRVFDIN